MEKVPSKTLLKRSTPLKQVTNWNPKKVFRSSFLPRWPVLDPVEEQQVVCLLEEAFAGLFVKRRGKRRKIRHSPGKNEWNGDLLVFGFNQVTRLAERGQLEAIFVVRDVEPDILIQHFPWLCFFRNMLLFPMQSSNMQRIRDFFQLHSLLVMGLRRATTSGDRNDNSSLQEQYSFTEFIDRLRALAPCFPNN